MAALSPRGAPVSLYSADRRFALLGDEVRRSTPKSSGRFGWGAAARGRRVIRFAARGAWRSAVRGGGGDGRTDRGRRRFRARWFVFKRLRDDFPPPRRAASASLASRRRPVRGLSILSPRRQAFSRISKLFQGNSKEIPSFSKLFQGFANFFLGRFEGNQGVIGRSTRNRVFSNFGSSRPRRAARRYAAERARDST